MTMHPFSKQGSANSSQDGRKNGARLMSIASAMLRRKWLILQAILIVASGLWTFWPAVHGQWIGDDLWYLVDNPLMSDPARIWKAWFQPGSWVEYYPIEETIQWIQWQMWHDDTFGYHLTNIILHIISALLVWRLFGKLGLTHAWMGGLIFIVHPMTVDSIALINELKTSLSMPPFLLTLCAWVDYEENKKGRDYWLALMFFIVAMLCKITMMMFPVTILIYAWWKRGRIERNDLKGSAPFFTVSLVLPLLSIYSALVYDGPDTSFLGDIPRGDFLARFVLAGQTIAFYFSRCFLPLVPTPIYPEWKVDPSSPVQYLPWVVLLGVIGLLWSKRNGWGRHALLGLGFFVIMLTPFWGLKWISYMNVTWVLEHLLYIPMLGLIGLVVASIGQIERQLSTPVRSVCISALVILAGLLAWESHGYAALYRDEVTLGSYAVDLYPGCTMAHNNLGVALAKAGRIPEAIEQFETALRIDPRTVNAHENLGNAFLKTGRLSDAIEQHREVVQLWPQVSQSHRVLGDDLMQAGRVSEAIAAYKEAVRLDSGSAWMHYNLGLVLGSHDQIADAIDEYHKALALNPDYAEAHNSLGIALFSTGRLAEARQQFEDALRLNPRYQAAQYNLSKLDGFSPDPNLPQR